MDFIRIRLRLRETLRSIPFIFWFYRQFVLIKVRIYLSSVHLSYGKRNADKIGKPVLAYLEMHLVTHCNIKCKGCSQFSPLAEKWFADIADHEKDMKRLSVLFSDIETIRFVGGEPLLHPEIEQFINITRKYFQRANICIATNGYELRSMSDNFWDTCCLNHIKINWTVYPPLFSAKRSIIAFVREKGIVIAARKYDRFRAILNLKGDSDPERALRFCRSLYFCPFLRQGKIYICSRPVVIGTFNHAFGTNIPASGSVDIHDPLINGWDILIAISKSSDTCRYCATRLSYFTWTETKFDLNEWNIA